MGFHCPDAASLALVEAAIRDGAITWHALPHNGQVFVNNICSSKIDHGLQEAVPPYCPILNGRLPDL